MKFNSQKQKIKHIVNLQIENETNIVEQKNKNNIINNDFNAKNKKSGFNQILREIETDWEEMRFSQLLEVVPDWRIDQNYGWKIEIGEFPESYIPFIKVILLYRNIPNTNDMTIHENLLIGDYKLITPLPNGNVRITVYGSFFIFAGTPGVSVNNRFEGKMKIQIMNPLSN